MYFACDLYESPDEPSSDDGEDDAGDEFEEEAVEPDVGPVQHPVWQPGVVGHLGGWVGGFIGLKPQFVLNCSFDSFSGEKIYLIIFYFTLTLFH